MDQPTYLEALRMGWMVFWRVLTAFFLFIFVANFVLLATLPELTRTEPSLWATLVPIAVSVLGSLFLLVPLIVRALLRKQFRGFRLRLIRDEPPPAQDTGPPAS